MSRISCPTHGQIDYVCDCFIPEEAKEARKQFLQLFKDQPIKSISELTNEAYSIKQESER